MRSYRYQIQIRLLLRQQFFSLIAGIFRQLLLSLWCVESTKAVEALFLVSHTMNCENFWRSWTCVGNTCKIERYDIYPHHRQGELVEFVRAAKPDVVIYVGAVEQYYGRPVPTMD